MAHLHVLVQLQSYCFVLENTTSHFLSLEPIPSPLELPHHTQEQVLQLVLVLHTRNRDPSVIVDSAHYHTDCPRTVLLQDPYRTYNWYQSFGSNFCGFRVQTGLVLSFEGVRISGCYSLFLFFFILVLA